MEHLNDFVVLFDGTSYFLCDREDVEQIIEDDALNATEIVTSFDMLDEADDFVNDQNNGRGFGFTNN